MILFPMPTNQCSISLGEILTILVTVALSLVPQKMFSQRRATVVFSNRILCVEPKNSIPIYKYSRITKDYLGYSFKVVRAVFGYSFELSLVILQASRGRIF